MFDDVLSCFFLLLFCLDRAVLAGIQPHQESSGDGARVQLALLQAGHPAYVGRPCQSRWGQVGAHHQGELGAAGQVLDGNGECRRKCGKRVGVGVERKCSTVSCRGLSF